MTSPGFAFDPVKPASDPGRNRPARIIRQQSEGLALITVETGNVGELHLTLTPAPHECVGSVARRLATVLTARHAEAVRVIGFGIVAASETFSAALRTALRVPKLPVIWVEGQSVTGHDLAGVQVHAVTGTEVRNVSCPDGSTARLWRDATTTQCVLTPAANAPGQRPASQQAAQVLVSLQSALTQAGMTLKHVVRTWFFLDDILGWYGAFNRVRNDFFAHAELRPGSVPVSTGVGGRNGAGSALQLVAWAVQLREGIAHAARTVVSPLQCPAPAYGSAFSRALEVTTNACRHLLISGTASIAPDGTTAHAGDMRAQVALTMQVVEAILSSRGMRLTDTTRATAYFKSASDAPVFDAWFADRGLSGMPVLKACCDICRDELRFELELDAIQAV